jgi:hypothetical protein
VDVSDTFTIYFDKKFKGNINTFRIGPNENNYLRKCNVVNKFFMSRDEICVIRALQFTRREVMVYMTLPPAELDCLQVNISVCLI